MATLRFIKQVIIFSMLSFLSGIAITFFYMKTALADAIEYATGNQYVIKRLDQFQYIRPVVSIDQATESPEYAPMKAELTAIVQALKDSGKALQVSVYLNDFEKGRWTAINPDEQYRPASLLKLGLLLAVLRQEELSPGFLNQTLSLSPQDTVGQQNQVFAAQTIRLRQQYTVRELLEYMVVHSDNNASRLLAANLNPAIITELFKELELPEVNFDRTRYLLNAGQTSAFLRAIFNSTLLSPEKSEYAASLLHRSAFDQGFSSGFPSSTKVWHKFGEWNDPTGVFELHQTAVFFIGNKPYLLTVMTRGTNPEHLSKVLQAMAEAVYKGLSA
jgi:beta-lactamase class A